MLRLTRSLNYLQPQGLNAQIEWDNAITEGLILAVRPHARRNDVNGRVALGLGAGMTDTIGQLGLERTQSGSQTSGDRYGNLGLASAQATHLQLLRVPTGTLAGSRSSGSWIAASRGFAFLHQANNFRAVRSTAGLNNVLTSTTNPTATASRNRPFVLVHVLGSAAQGIGAAHWHELWVNGRSEAYAAFGVPFTLPASGDEYVVGVSGAATGGDSAASYTASYGLQLVWNRALKDSEVSRITANPWQVYAGPSIWMPVSWVESGAVDYPVTPAGAAHAQTLGSPSLATGSSLAGASLTQAHALGSPALSTGTAIAPGAASHGHTLGAPSLTTAGAAELAPAALAHAHAFGSPAISTGTTLAGAALSHAQAIGQPSLATGTALAANSLTHAHVLDVGTVSTSGAANLNAAALTHAHSLALAALNTGTQINVGNLLHAHTLGAGSASTQTTITVAALSHAHAVAQASISTAGGAGLTPGAMAHAMAIGAPALSAFLTITPAGMLHAHSLALAAVVVPSLFVDGNLDVWRIAYRQRVTHIAPHRNMRHRYE